jgi:hypothetical protein
VSTYNLPERINFVGTRSPEIEMVKDFVGLSNAQVTQGFQVIIMDVLSNSELTRHSSFCCMFGW